MIGYAHHVTWDVPAAFLHLLKGEVSKVDQQCEDVVLAGEGGEVVLEGIRVDHHALSRHESPSVIRQPLQTETDEGLEGSGVDVLVQYGLHFPECNAHVTA